MSENVAKLSCVTRGDLEGRRSYTRKINNLIKIRWPEQFMHIYMGGQKSHEKSWPVRSFLSQQLNGTFFTRWCVVPLEGVKVAGSVMDSWRRVKFISPHALHTAANSKSAQEINTRTKQTRWNHYCGNKQVTITPKIRQTLAGHLFFFRFYKEYEICRRWKGAISANQKLSKQNLVSRS